MDMNSQFALKALKKIRPDQLESEDDIFNFARSCRSCGDDLKDAYFHIGKQHPKSTAFEHLWSKAKNRSSGITLIMNLAKQSENVRLAKNTSSLSIIIDEKDNRLPRKQAKWSTEALEDLKRSGISKEMAESAGFYPDTNFSYVIPFHDPESGKIMKSLKTGDAFFRRKMLKGKFKYLSQKYSGQRSFILSAVHKYLESSLENTVYLTEGEKKSLAATELGDLPCIGLTGNYGFTGPDKSLLPELESYAKTHKNWCVIWDSDGRNNKDFPKASKSFARLLNEYGCKLEIVYLSEIKGCNKVGIDDFLVNGGTAESLQKFIDENAELCTPDERSMTSKENGKKGGRPVINFDLLAAEFIKAKFTEASGRVSLKYYRGRWFSYNGSIYKELSEDALTSILVEYMSISVGTRAPNLSNFILALKHPKLCGFDHDLREPFNMETGEELKGYLTFANGDLIHPENFINEPVKGYIKGGSHIFTTRSLGFDFDSNATCSLYDKYLSDVHDDKDDIDELDKFSGYCLTESMRFNKMLVCVGPKGTGKTTYGLLLSEILGPYAATFELDDFKKDIEKNKLTNCRVLMLEEVEEYLEEGVIKGCTGSGKIKFRHHYKDSREEEKTAKLIMTSNDLKIKDRSGALLQDRMIISIFDKTIRGSDKEISDYHKYMFIKEPAGIFNRYLNGLRMIIESETPAKPFKETMRSTDFKEELAKECNPSLSYVKSAFSVDSGSFVTNAMITYLYEDYKRKLKDGRIPDSLKEFKSSIRAAFPRCKSKIVKRDGKATRGLEGVRSKVDISKPEVGEVF